MAKAEALIEAAAGNGVVRIKFFDGRQVQVDFTKSSWQARLDEHLVSYLADILSRYAFHGLEMTGLSIKPIF